MEQLLLKNQLCFRLYSLNKAMTRLYAPLLAQLQLTYPQYLVMLVLWQHNALTVNALGQQLDLDSGTLSPLLKRMEKQGLLIRKRDTNDERKVIVQLTSQGETLKNQATNIPNQLFDQCGLTADSYQQLCQEFDQLLANIKQHL
jgi:DNA-binding MarR family transcriptional regulator